MPVTVRKIDGKYSVSTPNQTHAYGTTKKKAQRQANLLRAIEHGWKPTGKPARESVQADAQHLVACLLGEAEVDEPLERGHVEPTRLSGGRYGRHVQSKGKTAGKFKFPANFNVGHAIKS